MTRLQLILIMVAPHAGAWIETLCPLNLPTKLGVAPHAGAWIETDELHSLSEKYESRPMRARGLKLLK